MCLDDQGSWMEVLFCEKCVFSSRTPFYSTKLTVGGSVGFPPATVFFKTTLPTKAALGFGLSGWTESLAGGFSPSRINLLQPSFIWSDFDAVLV